MPRPTILVVDTDDNRRKEVARGLSGFAYEVVTAADGDEGARFSSGLGPGIVIAEGGLPGFSDREALIALLGGEPPHVVPVLLETAEQAQSEPWPDGVTVVPVAGLTPGAILRKLRTFLIGRELGLEPDARLEFLLCDLSETPLFDLLPMLQKVILVGRVVMREGEIALAEGKVLSARCGRTRGVKAFARMGRSSGGTARILLGPGASEAEIQKDLLSLMAAAMEDQHRFHEAATSLPAFGCRVRVEMGPAFFSTSFTTTQQALLAAAQGRPSIWQLLDSVETPDGEALEALLDLRELRFVEFDEAETAVVVVTDSAADLSPDTLRRHGVQVVAGSILSGDSVFKDGLDITARKTLDLLKERKSGQVRTSAPSRGEWLAAFRTLLPKADVVAIHVSDGLSQTGTNARAAAEEVRAEIDTLRAGGLLAALEVVDSGKVSAGLGLLVLFAARMAIRGMPAREIADRVRAMSERVHVLFSVDDLEFLVRGGRLAEGQGLVGGLLGIRPVLGVVHGELGVADRVRGSKRILPRMTEILKGLVDPERPVVAGIVHAAAPDEAKALIKLVQEQFTLAELVEMEAGSVVAAHTGPGACGLALVQPSEEELSFIAPLE